MITENGVKAAIRKAQETQARLELRDDGERGAGRLVISVRAPRGKITAEWYAVYFRDGHRRMTKIGSYPALGVADARKRFREDYAPAISTGIDLKPSYFRTRQNAGPKVATVEALFDAYVAALKQDGKRSWDQAEAVLDGAAVALGADTLAAAIKPTDIVDHLKDIHDRGAVVMAAKTRAWISAAFAFGLKASNDYTSSAVTTEWGLTGNPVLAIPADASASRAGDRYLSPVEFRKFWEWLVAKDDISRFSRAVRLNMATGQRVEEILRISDTGYDPAERTLFWDKTKNGLPHLIPLCPQAVDILDDCDANSHGLYFWRRPAPSQPAPYASFGHLIAGFIKASGVPNFSGRDLRRTWKTLTGRAGISKEARDRYQNHAKGDISSRHYDRYDYLPEKRATAAAWGDYLARILAGEFDADKSAEVVQIGKAKAA